MTFAGMSFYILFFFFTFSVSKACKIHQFAYLTSLQIEDWELTTAKVCVCIENRMNARAFRYMGKFDVFQALKIARAAASAAWELEKYHEWP